MNLKRALARDLAEHHPDETAAVLEAIGTEESADFLGALPPDWAARVLKRTTAQPAAAILARLGAEKAALLVEQLPVDVAAGYLRRVDDGPRKRILDSVPALRARSLRALLRFRENSAGALMDPQVLAVPDSATVREAVDRVRSSDGNARYNLYVVDRDDRLVGVLNLRELLIAKRTQRVGEIMSTKVLRLSASADWRAVVEHRGWQAVHALPVVDESGVYLGAIRYRTLRRLEAQRNQQRDMGSVTSRALGDLFWTGVSGAIEAMTGPAPGTGPAAGVVDRGE